MRRLEAVVVIALVAALGAAGCSRLTFVKPNAERKDFEQVAPDYAVKPDKRRQGMDKAYELTQLANYALEQGDLATASQRGLAAEKADPNSFEAQTVLAFVADRTGRAEEAGRRFRRATDLAPARGGPASNYGAWLCRSGKPAESLPYFERALADSGFGGRVSTLANSGACAGAAGQTARAERELRAVLSVEPGEPVALSGLAEMYYRERRFLEARAFSERRLAVQPIGPDTLSLAARIEDNLGDKAAAARYTARLRTEFPQSPQTVQSGERATP